MTYNISDLQTEIRIALDQNATSTALIADVDTLSLEEIIESKIADAARIVESQAPFYLLDQGKALADETAITWQSNPGYGMGRIHLPDDFLRLICFKMSDWDMAVYEPITAADPLYSRQHSRFRGIRGNPQHPVVAIVSAPAGLMLEFFSCEAGANVGIEEGRYIAIPQVSNGTIELCEKLVRPIIYYAAYLTASSIGQADLATSMLNISNELMK